MVVVRGRGAGNKDPRPAGAKAFRQAVKRCDDEILLVVDGIRLCFSLSCATSTQRLTVRCPMDHSPVFAVSPRS